LSVSESNHALSPTQIHPLLRFTRLSEFYRDRYTMPIGLA
jgi:hypothetical protein